MHEPDSGAFDGWDGRIANEFAQCPGLRLTAAQAARFWGLTHDRTDAILAALVDRRLLIRTANGVFIRRGACPQCESP